MKKSLYGAAGAVLLTATSVPALAGAKIEIGEESWVSVGAGIRTAFTAVEDGAPSGDDYSTDFDVQNIRLYFTGQITDKIGITFNTDEIFGDGPVDTLDVIARFEFSEAFNVWMGRMLTPADRIEMNGPFYTVSWNQYTVPLYPSDQGGDAGQYGRDDGLTIWGDLGKFDYAVGAFEGLSGGPNDEDNLLYAARFAFHILNEENSPAYYTSSTYFGGEGNILTVAASFQTQDGGTGSIAESGDFEGFTVEIFSETVLGDAVLNFEAEYKEFDADYTVGSPAAGDCFCLFDGESYFGTAAFLFPGKMGPGRIQPYLRYVENSPSDGDDSDLTEFGVNYWISGYNAKLNVNFGTGDANISGYKGDDVDSFSIGVQLQI